MELLVTWIAVAGVCAWYASKKRRNPAVWLFLGLAFSVVALFVLWFLEPIGIDDEKSQQIARKFGVSARYRKCPACAELVQKEALKCRYCHTELDPITE